MGKRSRKDNRKCNSQMSQFVRGDDDAGEPPGVLDDGHGVDLLQPLVDDAGAAHVREAGRAPVALAQPALATAHVQSKNKDMMSFRAQ